MTHLAWKPDASFVLDSLLYTYATNTNRLQNVYDRRNDLLGDFKTAAQHTQAKTSATIDYTYDANGNMIKDLNKGIATTAGGTGITYNHLNLPSQITVRKNTTTSKGTITYTYDAAGTKLSKVTVDLSTTGKTITTTTNYMGGMVFESRTTSPIDANQPDYTHRLQFIAHEEGRVRFTPLSGAVPARFSYDYFLKDHLGNTRMVLTEEASSETYPALSFEGTAGSVEVQNQDRYWENKAGQSINVAGVRTMHSTGTNAMLTRKDLGAIGAAKLLKVMSGDKIQTSVQFHYTATNANNSSASGINSLVANITQLIANSLSPSEVIKSGVSSLGSSLSSQTALSNLLNTANATSGSNQAPKAYLHVLLFNDQFKFDAVNSKVIPVPYTVNSWGTLSRIGANAVSVKKNGYAYVYFSNESNELVYFDNFNLTHERGPVLEETHYYPFGLTMAGISSRAMGKLENNKKYNGIEFENDLDLNTYDAYYRELDPQTGRWWQIDPKIENMEAWSPYASNFDNPISFSDPLGDEPEEGDSGPPGGTCCGVGVGTLIKILDKADKLADKVGEYVRQGLVSAGGTLSGMVGLPNNMYEQVTGQNTLTESDQAINNSAHQMGQVAGMFTPIPVTPAPSLAVVSPKKITATAPALPISKVNTSSSNSQSGSNTSSATKQSKVEKSIRTEKIGEKYTKTTEVRPGKGPGQSRAEYIRYKNPAGKVIRTQKHTYDRGNNFKHKKPLRGGPEGRPQNE